MKTIIAVFALVIQVSSIVQAGGIADPQVEYLVGYQQGDAAKKIDIDIIGNGSKALFFATIPANPDPVDSQAMAQEAGRLFWALYVKANEQSAFTKSAGIDDGTGLIEGASVGLNPDQCFFGQISEIGKYGFVTSARQRSKSDDIILILAYTWEGDHLRESKLAEYRQSQQNAIFDKYLKDDKRTHVTLQQIKP